MNDLRYIDSDGHILEHPTAMPEYAAAEFRDRIWHIETDADGQEWEVFDGTRGPSNFRSFAGAAGFDDEKVEAIMRGEVRYTESRPAAWDAKLRLVDMDMDHIDLAVLYPTMLLGLQSNLDLDFGIAQARAYNDWCVDHVAEGDGRLFGSGALPPMHDAAGVQACADELRRVATLPGMVSVFMRPNPSVDWKPFMDPVYDPLWQAADETGLPIGIHPFFAADLPGAAQGLRLNEAVGSLQAMADLAGYGSAATGGLIFTQGIANVVDVMSALCFITAGGVCERFPNAKFIFLEANGGWLVPWLERLDHHVKKFGRGASWLQLLPSEYFRRQCWISFDPDEAMLRATAESPFCGADRIIWASDYPHPDAKFPGVTEELAEALDGLSFEQQRQITSESAIELYGIG
ncbi:MAG: amidohydrolase family protein [Acidimicrobiia bacterium]